MASAFLQGALGPLVVPPNQTTPTVLPVVLSVLETVTLSGQGWVWNDTGNQYLDLNVSMSADVVSTPVQFQIFNVTTGLVEASFDLNASAFTAGGGENIPMKFAVNVLNAADVYVLRVFNPNNTIILYDRVFQLFLTDATPGAAPVGCATTAASGTVQMATEAETRQPAAVPGDPPTNGSGGCPLAVNPRNLLLRNGAYGDLFSIAYGAAPNVRGAYALDIQSYRAAVSQVASGASSVAVGIASTAANLRDTVLGQYAYVNGGDSLAVGSNSRAYGVGTTSLGGYSDAYAQYATAVGFHAQALNISAVAVGGSNIDGNAANAQGANSTALGATTLASGTRSIAAGYGCQALAYNAVSIGRSNFTILTSLSAVAVGVMNNVLTVGNIDNATGVIVNDPQAAAAAIGINSTAVGIANLVTNLQGNALGFKNNITGSYGVGIGTFNTVSGTHATAIGRNNTASGVRTIAIGRDAMATAAYAIAMGAGSGGGNPTTASIAGAIAIGRGAQATTGLYAIAIGGGSSGANAANATYAGAIALGRNTLASNNNSFAATTNATASGSGSIAIGNDSVASSTDSIAIGADTDATTGNGAMAVGRLAQATAVWAMGVGYQANSSASGASAIGFGAQARVTDTTNIAGCIVISQDDGQGIANSLRRYAGARVIIMTPVVNLETVADQTVTLPAGLHFYFDTVGVIATNIVGLVTQPTVQFGVTGTPAQQIAPVVTTLLTASNTREPFTTLLAPQTGATSLVAGVTGAAAGTTVEGRFYWEGILLEDE